MAHFSGTFFSKSLSRPVHFTAVLCNDNAFPTQGNPYYERATKNIYLLHGYSGCDTDWFVNAPLGDIANRFNVNFFLPNGDNSFYLNQPQTGFKYQDYVGVEFVDYTRKTFNLLEKCEDTYIGGLSMGGFGSIHTALAYPETFSKVIALSSAIIIDGLPHFTKEMDNPMANFDYYEHTFGDLTKVVDSDANPKVLVKKLKEAGKAIPKFFMACGTEDFLIEPNKDFKSFLESEGVSVEFNTAPGIHDFNFWRTWIVEGVKWAVEN